MGLQDHELSLSITVIRYGVEHSVLHENADCSTYEGGEEMYVYVITCAVETPSKDHVYVWFKAREREKDGGVLGP